MYKQKVTEILNHEMSRQDFLKASGVLMVTLMGLPALMHSIAKLFSTQQPSQQPLQNIQANGYGGRAYGR